MIANAGVADPRQELRHDHASEGRRGLHRKVDAAQHDNEGEPRSKNEEHRSVGEHDRRRIEARKSWFDNIHADSEQDEQQERRIGANPFSKADVEALGRNEAGHRLFPAIPTSRSAALIPYAPGARPGPAWRMAARQSER